MADISASLNEVDSSAGSAKGGEDDDSGSSELVARVQAENTEHNRLKHLVSAGIIRGKVELKNKVETLEAAAATTTTNTVTAVDDDDGGAVVDSNSIR